MTCPRSHKLEKACADLELRAPASQLNVLSYSTCHLWPHYDFSLLIFFLYLILEPLTPFIHSFMHACIHPFPHSVYRNPDYSSDFNRATSSGDPVPWVHFQNQPGPGGFGGRMVSITFFLSSALFGFAGPPCLPLHYHHRGVVCAGSEFWKGYTRVL